MQCEHAQEFFSEYVSGEMDRALAVTLENHLNACNPCSETVDGLRQLWETLDRMPIVEPPASFHASLMDRLAAEPIVQKRSAGAEVSASRFGRQFQVRALAYAATIVVLLMGAEFVQVQRAALGPLGVLINVLHPAPVLSMQHVEWKTASVSTGDYDPVSGTLSVVLQAHAQVNGAVARDRVHVQVKHANGAITPETARAFKDGLLTSERPETFTIPLVAAPHPETDVVEVTVTPFDGATPESRTVTIPITGAP